MARVVLAVISAAVLGAFLVGVIGSLVIAISIGVLLLGIGLGVVALIARLRSGASRGTDA